ncbi:hypothetical protein [Nocardioides sp. CFH 31398]|uniref:hypothetical protein n=1 Tax=Nocardioides sp. CFH 31398 TaxID=2919579 RepID=UPI001F06E48C|nr:hypothetical protein [Nocardioides sp. CFH 31398]MCH1867565.1 hypothetical protein [Nocardioides sp. CFH 31398]
MRASAVVHLLPLLAVLAGASLALAVPPGHAEGRGPSVGLSPDGGRYADSLEGPLFDEALRWVPGDRRSASWWVRNESADTARLSVEVPEDAVVPGWLGVSTRADDGWTPVAADASGVVGLLAPGEERRVDLRVDMRPGAGNASERGTADLRLRVRLTEEVPGGGPDEQGPGGAGPTAPGDGSDHDGLLPGTGSPLGLGLLLLAALLVGLGAALLRRAARDRDGTAPAGRPTAEPAPAEVPT